MLGETDQVRHCVQTIAEDRRMHAALGRLQRQKALDCFQQEHLSAAIRLLDEWRPLDEPSIAELVVQCQLETLHGKILRYQGKLSESLRCLHGVEKTMERASARAKEQGQRIFWDEDAGELMPTVARREDDHTTSAVEGRREGERERESKE